MNYDKIRLLLSTLYGEYLADSLLDRSRQLIDHYRTLVPIPDRSALNEQDAILITYPDQVTTSGEHPLKTLNRFCCQWIHPFVSGIHILPYYPSSSDDGFSVIDYKQVDPIFGTWNDIQGISQSFRLMSDCVINHVSSFSRWFQAFLEDVPRYRDFFITPSAEQDLSMVVRPRTNPLLTPYLTAQGPRRVWTTFSDDQIDLNFSNPDVLFEILDVILFLTAHGVQVIRLDAIGYVWKQPGTSCINSPETHAIVKLIRAILEQAAPHTLLITETNVSHPENIAYFGQGNDEAHLVYNFTLPPLVLHTLLTGDSTRISEWAVSLERVPPTATFFNFLASHDGIGINPVEGLLTGEEVTRMINQTLAHGGLVSNKRLADGSEKVYELNINFFDALSDPASTEDLQVQIDRFMAAQAIMLTLRGVPGIYFHSLFGLRSWHEGVELTGRNRTINRQKFTEEGLISEITDPDSLVSQVYLRYRDLLQTRASLPAFHPLGRQVILNMGTGIFAVLRIPPDDGSPVLCLQNVTGQQQTYEGYSLKPYETLWVELESLML